MDRIYTWQQIGILERRLGRAMCGSVRPGVLWDRWNAWRRRQLMWW